MIVEYNWLYYSCLDLFFGLENRVILDLLIYVENSDFDFLFSDVCLGDVEGWCVFFFVFDVYFKVDLRLLYVICVIGI